MRRPGTHRPVSRLAAMPGRTQITLLACLCAAVLAGCGSDEEGTIPQDNSAQLIDRLDAVEERVAAGDCESAQQQADAFVAEVNELPAEVDDEVKGGLQDGADRLVELSNDQCEDTTGETGFDNLEPTTTTPTTTTPTTTETTTTETDEETTTTETAEEDGEEDAEEQQPTPPEDAGGGPDTGGGPPISPPGGGGGEGTVPIPGDDEPTSGGIGGDKGPRQ
jgi:cobalamin biosynthesis protein CobT